jgi:hypothetical protein
VSKNDNRYSLQKKTQMVRKYKEYNDKFEQKIKPEQGHRFFYPAQVWLMLLPI